MCDEAISLYNSFLVENGKQPFPVYWSQPNCGGSFYPTIPEENTSGGTFLFESNVEVKSFYCPPNVNFTTTGPYDPDDPNKFATKSTIMANVPNAAELQLLVTNADDICVAPLFFGANVVGAPNATMANSFSTTFGEEAPVQLTYTYGKNRFDMCTGNTVTMVGDSDLSGAFYPQSPACDSYMTQYCDSNPDKQICNCFRDRETLRKLMPDVVLPVRCLGPNCAITGYLTDTMLQQGCDMEMCQRVTQMYGANIVTGGQTSIYCGNRLYAVTPTPGPTATRPIRVDDDRESTATWILAAVGAVILAVVIGLFYRYRPGSKKR